MKKCTVLVLNYNGKQLLEKNLPAVVKAANRANFEVAVVDNGSDDGSIVFLKQYYPNVFRIVLARNYGFAQGNNRAIKKLSSDIVILLNNDVLPQPNAFLRIRQQFKDPKVFAVSFRQRVKVKSSQFVGGFAIGEFSRGLLRHRPLPRNDRSLSQVVPALYASGGAAAFDRKKFLQLGGFDSLYQPFYWEDTDLSTKAWSRGWLVLFDPQAQVEHRHETTIKKLFPAWYVRAFAGANMLVYNWRHLNGWHYWLVHLAWLPFHILRRPLAFLMALRRLPQIVVARSRDPHRLDIGRLLNQIKTS